MSRSVARRSIGAMAVMLLGTASSASAQDCTSAPLLAGRAAAGLAMAHSADERAAGASLTADVGAQLRVSGAYRAARLDDVDRLRHEGRIELARPLSMGPIALCPLAGSSYGRLSTSRSGMQGRVTTRETWIGTEIGRSVSLPRAFLLTPFAQPMLVRRAVSWRSSEAGWDVVDDLSATSAQLWLGLSLATRRSALVARYRPAEEGRRSEVELQVVTALGAR